MTSTTHETFVIDRQYRATPERVFAAFADPAAKEAWFGTAEGWITEAYEVDFRVGGHEYSSARPGPHEQAHIFDSMYLDIVDNRRIIFAYNMSLDDRRITSSLTTIEFEAHGDGTHLRFTEQIAFLDGSDHIELRIQGTEEMLAALGTHLGATAQTPDVRRQTSDT